MRRCVPMFVLFFAAACEPTYRAVPRTTCGDGDIAFPLSGTWAITDTLVSREGPNCAVDMTRFDWVQLSASPLGLFIWTDGRGNQAQPGSSRFDTDTGNVRTLTFAGPLSLETQEDRQLHLTDETLTGTTKFVVGDSSGAVFCTATYSTTGQRQ